MILHYVFKLVVFYHLCSVHMLDCFGDVFFVSPSMVWTSIFDKFKSVCILSSMCWTYWIFVHPWVGRIEYLLVHRLDSAQILCPRFLPRLIFGRVYLVMKGILAFHLCRPENFLVHGLADLNKNLNKSNMGIMDSHNTMYIT